MCGGTDTGESPRKGDKGLEGHEARPFKVNMIVLTGLSGGFNVTWVSHRCHWESAEEDGVGIVVAEEPGQALAPR